jgi:hypothetical protein
VFSAIKIKAIPDSKNNLVKIRISRPSRGTIMSPKKPSAKSPPISAIRPPTMKIATETPTKIIEIRYKTLATGLVINVLKDLSVSAEKKFFMYSPC